MGKHRKPRRVAVPRHLYKHCLLGSALLGMSALLATVFSQTVLPDAPSGPHQGPFSPSPQGPSALR
ncbi:hypothetical protein [Streptomyces pathocidini]|uniref:hypothetical protein n=1 Tax=Streptomyces pathocidini TaxID=1650571 RepID=UPI0006E30D22|nr:hypothetical protein [Streptomyces pathocidini]